MNPVSAVKEGNEQAFEEIYQQYHRKLYHFFIGRTADADASRELVQQAFIKIWNGRHNLAATIPLDAQCFTVANSVLVDHLRKLATEKKYYRQIQMRELQADALEEPVSTSMESNDYLQVVAGQLPPVRRNIFILKIKQGYSNKEIAEQLSISVKTVEDHYSKALRHIRSLV